MLRKLLQGMLDEASRNLNVPAKRKVKGNLHLALAMTDKMVHLSISRDETYPSESEWKTTLDYFPYYVPFVKPIKFINSARRFAMRAKLPRREDVPQQLPLATSESNENVGQ